MLFNMLFGVLLCIITFLFFKEISWGSREIYSNAFMEALLIIAGLFIIITGDSTIYYLTLILTVVMFNFYVSIALAVSSGRRLLPEVIFSVGLLTVLYICTRSFITSASIFGLVFPILLIMGFWRLQKDFMKYFEIVASILITGLTILYVLGNSIAEFIGILFFVSATCLSICSILILYSKREYLQERSLKNSAREMNRKIVHLIFATGIGMPFFGIIVPIELLKNMLVGIIFLFTHKSYIIEGLRIIIILVGGSLLLVVMFFEKLRLSKDFALYPKNLLREVEKRNFATYVYFLVSMFVIAVLYNEYIFVVSVIVALVADTMSAVIGEKFGKKEITKNRTLEGTLAGFISAYILLELFTKDFIASIVVALVIAILDVFYQYLKVDDNLLFPNIIALLLFLMW